MQKQAWEWWKTWGIYFQRKERRQDANNAFEKRRRED